MSDGVEVWKGGVAPWECDSLGHLNVGFHAAKAMDALAVFAAELGMPHAFAVHAEATLQVREQYVRFRREAHVGAGLSISAGVTALSECEARLLLLMRHDTGELAAAFHLLVAHVTAREARPFPWPPRLREKAEALRIEIPEAARPRSLEPGPVESAGSLRRAEELGLRRTGLGVFRPADCDVFGRMRAEGLTARVADTLPHLYEVAQPGESLKPGGIGGVALEHRLVFIKHPVAGDRFEMRSGVRRVDAGTRRTTHWMLDPASGEIWGATEVVSAALDLETRRILTLSEAEVADWNTRTVAGLTI